MVRFYFRRRVGANETWQGRAASCSGLYTLKWLICASACFSSGNSRTLPASITRRPSFPMALASKTFSSATAGAFRSFPLFALPSPHQ